MSLLPAFEMGLWNAWIFTVPLVLTIPIFYRVCKDKDVPDMSKMRLSKTKAAFLSLSKLIYFPAMIYSVFLPLELGTIWFYVGLPITLVGMAGYMMTLVSWANTPPGEPVTRGIYRYSRHPQYVTMLLFLLGVSIASASWVFLLFPIIGGVGIVYFIRMEEAQCLGHYGTTYREYMDRTPRWIGIPKPRKK